jgi:hypothetical protein
MTMSVQAAPRAAMRVLPEPQSAKYWLNEIEFEPRKRRLSS